MELADVTDSKSVGLITRAGSTPATGIGKLFIKELPFLYKGSEYFVHSR